MIFKMQPPPDRQLLSFLSKMTKFILLMLEILDPFLYNFKKVNFIDIVILICYFR
jgi:hypothetical protein